MYNSKETYQDYCEDKLVEWLNENRIDGMNMLSMLMDDDIRERLNFEMAPCTDEEFIRAYCKAHYEKYHDHFLVSGETHTLCF